jgi:hypothetical protein
VSYKITRKLQFFKDCLDAENNSKIVWNFPSSSSESVKSFSTISSPVVVGSTHFKKLHKTLDYYRREKHLVFNAYSLKGRFETPSFGGSTKNRIINCPILLFPSVLDKNSKNEVFVDFQKGSINSAAAQILEYFGLNADDYFNPLLKSFLKNEEPEKQDSILNSLADELNEKSLAQMVLKTECGLSIERKQASAQGSLFELESLATKHSFSLPLKSILKESNSLKPSFWKRLSAYWPSSSSDTPLPEVLSDAQSSVLDAAAKYPLSIVSGPPGTGKSFTIACLALREFSKGNSVLVVSQNQHAADVVRRKLIDQMGIEPGLTVLGSEQGISPEVKSQIKLMLTLRGNKQISELKNVNRELTRLSQQRIQLESTFDEKMNSLKQGEEHKTSLWKLKFWNFGLYRNDKKADLLSTKYSNLESLDEKIKGLIVKFMAVHYRETAKKLVCNADSRKSLELFAKSLTARNQHYQEKYYKQVNFAHVLKGIPFWFSSLGNLHRLLPLQKELFDLVVIDEATQCNMAVCLPALQRAKRVVVLGDPKQLKHVSFVSFEQQQILAELHDLNSSDISHNFRGNSVLDYAQSACELAEQSSLLDEHFRSHPQIIQFSNSEFYQNELKIMTERPTNRQRSVEIINVNGKRLSKGVNKQEADAVLSQLQSIITEQRKLPETEVHTLGVLAFFSSQASYIEKMVFNEVSLNDMRRHNIRVGSPFSFQGEERNHMLISCSVDAKTSGNSYTYLNRDDVFNVAITRARDFQTLFTSCELDALKSGSKLKAYLKYVNEYKYESKQQSDIAHDSFQNEICNWLTKRGVDVFKNYTVAGISIDIMAVYHGHAVAIDLIGYEGDLHDALPLTQFKLLQRAGLESFLLPYQEWRDQTEKVLHALMLRLGAAHSLPGTVRALDKYSDQQEKAFNVITNGLSINELNARFLRNEEVAAVEQLAGLIARYQGFFQLLNTHFIPNEITYKRYLNAFNELITFCLSNLQKASIAAELATSMLEQQKSLYGNAQFNNEFDDVIAARLSMVDEQRAKFKVMISENEKALLQIDKTMLKLSDISDDNKNIDPIDALKELSDRLELYRGKTLTKE